ncbi:MAG: DUF6468 domain-containing protein [Acetobacteraceae bacterium]|nr:DUF6468 domain-containing protein [Acetobacteraceae bacterium]
MGTFDWGLELVLVALLALTLVHAVRLERALRKLRSDRAALGDAIAGFDDSARQAEVGIGRLQSASAETVALLSQRLEQSGSLKDDLAFLIERGETLADRLDNLVRSARPLERAAAANTPPPAAAAASAAAPTSPKLRSKAERELLLALQKAQ